MLCYNVIRFEEEQQKGAAMAEDQQKALNEEELESVSGGELEDLSMDQARRRFVFMSLTQEQKRMFKEKYGRIDNMPITELIEAARSRG